MYLCFRRQTAIVWCSYTAEALRRVAECFQICPAVVGQWADRYRVGVPMDDGSSRPEHGPYRFPARQARMMVLRFSRRWGDPRIVCHVGPARSTAGSILTRYRMPPLAYLDRATEAGPRHPSPVRYEKDRPGRLVHVDIKILGRIPPGAGGGPMDAAFR